MKKYLFWVLFILTINNTFAQKKHTFELGKDQFLLDHKPYQIISAEMHPARIPFQYWRHRIKMAKAMGCNTIAAYVFWNYHEEKQGVFDFTSENHNIVKFIKMAQEEGLWVLLRPGPYVCAEWDFGGLPAWLLKNPDIKLRCLDPVYMQAVTRYIKKLSTLVAPLQISKGGPILMVQVENEYGSYGNDQQYIATLAKLWRSNGINVPFYTADGPTAFMLEAGAIDGAAVGLDSGSSEQDFKEAQKHNPNVPAFSSESYPGWLTHWGEKWARPDTAGLLKEIKFLLDTKRSVNFYVAHGGTNFGYWAGANAFKPTEYQPDITSYDYDAPISEDGSPKPKFFALRNLIGKYVKNIPDLPTPPVSSIEIPTIHLNTMTSVWDNLPKAIYSPQPKPMEAYGQNSGFMLYRTKLIGHKSGSLTITEPHDYATVFLNGKYIGHIFRDGGNWTIQLPKSDVKDPILEIFVEGMGRINFAQYMIDRKGITDRVTLNGMTLMNWETFLLPFDSNYLKNLKNTTATTNKQGVFFKGSFDLTEAGDTYLDMRQWKKGIVWVNGRNLGKYWDKGPQQRLYCPGVWLKKGKNEIIIFDTHQTESSPVKGYKSME